MSSYLLVRMINQWILDVESYSSYMLTHVGKEAEKKRKKKKLCGLNDLIRCHILKVIDFFSNLGSHVHSFY